MPNIDAVAFVYVNYFSTFAECIYIDGLAIAWGLGNP